jgi:hypothetical protein
MTKICPKCKTENMDDAGFCQNCGEELDEAVKVPVKGNGTGFKTKETGAATGGWWSKQSTGVKAGIGIAGVCCIGLILLVALGGFLSPDKTNNTANLSGNFTGGNLTFNYPAGWTNSSTGGEIVSGGSSLVKLGTLVSADGLTLHVSTADLSSLGDNITIEEMKTVTKKNFLNGSSAQIISDNRTTVRGLNVYELVFTVKDPNTNQDQKTLQVITGKDGKTVYYMQFIADNKTFEDNIDLINQIIGTIKIAG